MRNQDGAHTFKKRKSMDEIKPEVFFFRIKMRRKVVEQRLLVAQVSLHSFDETLFQRKKLHRKKETEKKRKKKLLSEKFCGSQGCLWLMRFFFIHTTLHFHHQRKKAQTRDVDERTASKYQFPIRLHPSRFLFFFILRFLLFYRVETSHLSRCLLRLSLGC